MRRARRNAAGLSTSPSSSATAGAAGRARVAAAGGAAPAAARLLSLFLRRSSSGVIAAVWSCASRHHKHQVSAGLCFSLSFSFSVLSSCLLGTTPVSLCLLSLSLSLCLPLSHTLSQRNLVRRSAPRPSFRRRKPTEKAGVISDLRGCATAVSRRERVLVDSAELPTLGHCTDGALPSGVPVT